ncbi:hypothetical protein [Carboxydothermus pertinax]|uniref:Uncharacterized protein n=1 Tax=Carboxydothermus pertinax TaxID=870242 RepID=A0A1L8CU49_9THEO|nr:hypothetical protein [Carboxydothermus pertinax]GAV22443.1 hypothetical protein cpu_09530 [Carboxydothermus pertinax]
MRRDFIGGLLAGSLIGLTLAASVTTRKDGRKMVMREGGRIRKKFMGILDDLT